MAVRHPLDERYIAGSAVAVTVGESVADVDLHSHPFDYASRDLALDGACSVAYNEDAFRYFVEIERRRAETLGRPMLLLLLDLKKQVPQEATIPPAIAERLFVALAGCLRDTDFLGWYHEGRVIGAVLTQDAENTETRISSLVAGRVTTTLGETLPSSISARVQVRIYQLPSAGSR